MPTSVKIAIIGAGSAQFSGGIVRDLCVNPGLQGSHVAFMDIDGHRLEMVGKLADRLAAEFGSSLSFSCTTDRCEALQGADFVINTAQIGGHAWTEAQRTLAEQHGYYRGIRLHDFGQADFFLEVARDVERICPDAWLIQSANPVFEGCTLMHRETDVKVLGLCHGHYGYRHVARVLGLELDQVSARTSGFNHWIWMTDFQYRGENAYPLLDDWIDTQAETYWAQDGRPFWDNQMSRAAIDLYQTFGLLPIGDTPRFAAWWHHVDLAAKQHWYGQVGGFDSAQGWGDYLDRLETKVREVARVATGEEDQVTSVFEPVQSDEQIVPIVDALVNDRPGLYQVNIPNSGPIMQGFPQDLVIECQGVVDGSGVHGVNAGQLPQKLNTGIMVPRWRQAELVVGALQQGDRDLLKLYLLNDHRTRNLEQAEALLDAWLADPRNERMARLF